MMKKIISLIRKKYKIAIPISVIIVLLLAFIIYRMEYEKSKYRSHNTYGFYQYILDTKYEYDMVISTNINGEITEIEAKKYNIVMDSTPIYYNNEKRVIFPSEASVVFSMREGIQYRLLKNTSLEYKNNLYYLITESYSDYLNYFFIYDGMDMYFFPDEVTLKIGTDEITLSPMSYLFARYGNSVEYYDYANDNYEIRNITNERVIVSNDHLRIDVINDYLMGSSNQVLLSSDLNYLDTIDEAISK